VQEQKHASAASTAGVEVPWEIKLSEWISKKEQQQESQGARDSGEKKECGLVGESPVGSAAVEGQRARLGGREQFIRELDAQDQPAPRA
jgi:hypothetical protein